MAAEETEAKITNWIVKQVCRLPQPWRFIAFCAAVLLLIGAIVLMFGQVRSCGYDKAQKEYEEQSKQWATERAGLISRAEESERREKEKEIQAAAYKAAAEAGKRVDDETAKKIEDVSREAANAESNAEVSVACRVRADRLCNLFRASDKRFNCAILYDECK